jgi:hypothetical protein
VIERARYSVGSIGRASLFGAFIVVLGWLGYVSIGASAVVVLVLFVAMGHWVPYVIVGRYRLVVDEHSLIDHTRFRNRTYRWSDVSTVRVQRLARASYGLVVDWTDAEGQERCDFLRSSWRPNRDQVERLQVQIHQLGVPSAS